MQDWAPLLRFLGSVPGYRGTASALLKAGHWVAVIPGGLEEALAGHESSYALNWPAKRRGFVEVAREARVPIVPVMVQNSEEMKFNVLFWLWNVLRLHRPGWAATRLPVVGPAFFKLGMFAWFLASWFALPVFVPVPVTIHIGAPIEADYSRESVEAIRLRAEAALQRLIDKYQPIDEHSNQRKSYVRALRQRFC